MISNNFEMPSVTNYVSEPAGAENQTKNAELEVTNDGIFLVALPESVTLKAVMKVTSDILECYKNKHSPKSILRVLADGSRVKSYTPEALLIGVYTISNYPNLKMAIVNRTSEYKKIEESFYSNHKQPKNIENFRNKESAISWLNS